MASDDQKQMQVDAKAGDIVCTPNISGVWANFMRQSIEAAGLDPTDLPPHEGMDMKSEARAWKNIWSAGQGVTGIDDIPAAAELCHRLIAEYRAAIASVTDDPYAHQRPSTPAPDCERLIHVIHGFSRVRISTSCCTTG